MNTSKKGFAAPLLCAQTTRLDEQDLPKLDQARVFEDHHGQLGEPRAIGRIARMRCHLTWSSNGTNGGEGLQQGERDN